LREVINPAETRKVLVEMVQQARSEVMPAGEALKVVVAG
jgi:hypothetical protein